MNVAPREYVGNELFNKPVIHPNHEMDSRPACIHVGWKGKLLLCEGEPILYSDYPAGCGSD